MWRKRDNPSLQSETQNEDPRTVKENLFRAAELAILRHERVDRKSDKKHPFPSPPPRKRFDIDWLCGFLYWHEDIKKDRRDDNFIDLYSVREIIHKTRFGRDFPQELNEAECFTIYYGDEFNMQHLIINAPGDEDAIKTWVSGLKNFVHKLQTEPFMNQYGRMILREYRLAQTGGRSHGFSNQMAPPPNVTQLVNYFKSRGIPKTEIRRHQREHQEVTNLASFEKLFQKYILDSQNEKLLSSIMTSTSRHEESGNVKFGQYEITQLFGNENDEEVHDFLSKTFKDNIEGLVHSGIDSEHTLTKNEIFLLLFSDENSILDPDFVNTEASPEYLSAPMSHYWINSSHNTYLTGNQYASHSTVECYVRALRQGCRCIELDCWDGDNNEPDIWHGHTMTSKVKFIEVVKVIAEHAFETTDLPLILSIENHCKVEQQDMMAFHFKQYFGDMLLVRPFDSLETELPSPLQLKRKIIIKNRKLPKTALAQMVGDVIGASTGIGFANICDHDDADDKQFQGAVSIVGPDQNAYPRYLTLYENGILQFSKLNQPHEQPEITNGPESISEETVENDTMGSSWYHGKISRDVVQQLLSSNGEEGCWLVRDSAHFPGDYTLSFLRNNVAKHIRIKNDRRRDKSVLFIYPKTAEHPECDTLETLIGFYRTNDLHKGIRLGPPVPVPRQHLEMNWFYESLTREQAQRALTHSSVPNGNFLVRSKGNDEFGLSFRYDQEGPTCVKHAKIQFYTDEDQSSVYRFGNIEFPSLVLLVEHYQKHAFYRGQALCQPIDRRLLSSVISQPVMPNPDQDYVVQMANLRVRVEHQYVAERQDELTIRPNEIIRDVQKRMNQWWFGTLEVSNQEGWFPANYVREIREDISSDLFQEALNQGNVKLKPSFHLVPSEQSNQDFLILRDGTSSSGQLVIKTSNQESENQVETQRNHIQHHDADPISQLRQSIQVLLDSRTSLSPSQTDRNVHRISENLSNLVIYCQAVSWSEELFNKITQNLENQTTQNRDIQQMSSIGELKIKKYTSKEYATRFLDYNTWQFSRTYPKGNRLDSVNYIPISAWNAGCQMVALNFQSPDLGMQLNHARFYQYRGCGFIRKPAYMLSKLESYTKKGQREHIYCPSHFNPHSENQSVVTKEKPLILEIEILAGRHLLGLGSRYQGSHNSHFEFCMEIIGIPSDTKKNEKFRFKQDVPYNTFNPVFNSKRHKFTIRNRDLAFLKFTLTSSDAFGENQTLGVACFPVSGIRPGYRSIPMCNTYMERIEHASFLAHVHIDQS